MKYDTAGNPIKEPISGCDCGLTGGCEKCNPDLFGFRIYPMNKEIKVTGNYSEFGSKSDGETNLVNKEKKEKKPKYYYDWLEARCIYTNTGCLSQKELGGLEDPKNVNKPMKKKQKKIKRYLISTNRLFRVQIIGRDTQRQ